MKLYATITSERDARPARKGGDEYITIDLSGGNLALTRLRLRPARTEYEKAEGEYVLEWHEKDVSKRLAIIVNK